MKTKIENAKTIFFKDKQHYLAFRKSWAEAVNSPKAMSTLVKVPYLRLKDDGFYETIPDGAVVRCYGWISAAHHVVYNLLREKDAGDGFTPITNRTKLDAGVFPERVLLDALALIRSFEWQITSAKSVYNETTESKSLFGFMKPRPGKILISKDEQYEMRMVTVNKFLAPFNGTVTVDMLIELSTMVKEMQK